MATGDSNDILERVKKLLPRRWFSWGAPLRDALIGGIADGAERCYNLYTYAKSQSRLATSSGPFLDIIAYDYLGTTLPRGAMSDDVYRQLILVSILQPRVTRAAMIAVLERITGNTPDVFEPWNTYDTGAYGVPSMGYGVGRGGWGNMDMPGESFIHVYRGEGSGVPNVAGWGASLGGWGIGAIEWIGTQIGFTGITDEFLYQIINQTRPTGSAVWVQFANGIRVVVPPPTINTYKLTTVASSIAITGNNSFARLSTKLVAFSGSFSLTGVDSFAVTSHVYKLTAQKGTFNITGVPSFRRLTYKLTAQTRSFTLTAFNAGLSHGTSRSLLATPGSFTLTGFSSTFASNAPSMDFSNVNNSQYIALILMSSSGTTVAPSLNFSDSNNSGYVPLI